jgi:hypothetical protein
MAIAKPNRIGAKSLLPNQKISTIAIILAITRAATAITL